MGSTVIYGLKIYNSKFSLGKQGDDVLLNFEGFHHGGVPSERLPVLVEQNLLPVPADVLLRHWRVEQEVCVVKEGRDRRRAPAQSPLVEGNSGGTVDIRSGKKRESGFKTVARSNVPDNIGDLGRVPGWLLIEELSACNILSNLGVPRPVTGSQP